MSCSQGEYAGGADPFNASRLNTTIAAVITSNTALAAMPGNVFIPASASGSD